MRYEFDAKVLAVQSMQGTPLEDSVLIPQYLIDAKMNLLLMVHNASGLEARDTVIDCLNIHLDSLEHSLRYIAVTADTGVFWLKKLAGGALSTGNQAVDGWIDLYGLTVQETSLLGAYRYVLLRTGQDYNTAAIAKKWMELDSVADANHKISFCWGCHQIYEEEPVIDTFSILKYLYCWGDDCGYHRTWEFHLPLGCEAVSFAGSYHDVLETGTCDQVDAIPDRDVYEYLTTGPNPANEFFFLKITSRQTMHGWFNLVNLPGRIVKSEKMALIAGEEKQFSIETKDLPDGLYFLILKLDNRIFTKKLIIHHR